MSSTYASNTVEEAVKVMISVTTEAFQTCQTQYFQSQQFTIKGNTGVTINIGDIDWSQVVSTDLTCTQTNSTQNSINTNVKETVSQLAKAINQQFSLNPGSTDSQNVTSDLTQIGVAIVESFNQTCKQVVAQDQGVTIEDNVNSTINIATLDWNQTIDGLINCIQTNTSVNNATTKLTTDIEQKAEAIVQNFLGPIIWLLIIVAIIIIAVVFGGLKTVTNWKFLLVVGIFIAGYILAAFFLGWWPFHNSR